MRDFEFHRGIRLTIILNPKLIYSTKETSFGQDPFFNRSKLNLFLTMLASFEAKLRELKACIDTNYLASYGMFCHSRKNLTT